MIIHKEESYGEYNKVARVLPDGSVEGDTDFANTLKDDLQNGGISHPDGSSVEKGSKLMLLLSHRFNNVYYMAEWEQEDYEMLHDMIEK